MNIELLKRFVSSLIIFPIALLFIYKGSVYLIFFLSILLIITSYEWIKMNKKKDLNKILGVIFLILSFYSAYSLRSYAGLNFFLLIVLICISTDIGGYIFGKLFKGPKLTKISPNKTISGSIGSFVFSVFPLFIYIMIRSFENFYIFDNHIRYYFTFNFIFSFKKTGLKKLQFTLY